MSICAYLAKFGKEILEINESDKEQKAWIKQLKKAVLQGIKKQTGQKTEWAEGAEPDQQVGEELGGWGNLIQLQRYAAHIDFTGRPPEAPVENEYLDNDEMLLRFREAVDAKSKLKISELRFCHLIMIRDQPYFIPVDFPEPIHVEVEEERDVISVGSSYRLLFELEELNKHLSIPGDYGQLGEGAAWEFYDDEKDSWRFVKWTWIVLHWLARESIDRKLCIYFE